LDVTFQRHRRIDVAKRDRLTSSPISRETTGSRTMSNYRGNVWILFRNEHRPSVCRITPIDEVDVGEPGWVNSTEWAIPHVTVAIEALQISRIRYVGVRREHASE